MPSNGTKWLPIMTYINHLYTWSAGNLEDMLMKQILMKRIYIWMTEPFLNQEWVCNEYIPFNDHYKQHWHNLMVTGKQLIIDSSIFGFANDFNILDEFCKLPFTDNWRWIPLFPYCQDFANDRNKLILPANVCIAPISFNWLFIQNVVHNLFWRVLIANHSSSWSEKQ